MYDLPHLIVLWIIIFLALTPFILWIYFKYNVILRLILSFVFFYLAFVRYFNIFYLNPDNDTRLNLKNRIIEDYYITDSYAEPIRKNLSVKFAYVKDTSQSWSETWLWENSFNSSKSNLQKIQDSLNVVIFDKDLGERVWGSYITFKYINWNEVTYIPFLKPFIKIYLKENEKELSSFTEPDKKEIVYHEFLHYIFDLKTKEDKSFPIKVNKEFDKLDDETKKSLFLFLESYNWSPEYSMATEKYAYLWAQILKWNKNSLIIKKNPFLLEFYKDVFK